MMHDGKRFLLCLLLLPLLLSCGVIVASEANGGQAGLCQKFKPCQLLAQSEAERILGQPVRQIHETAEPRGDVRQCRCAYMGLSKDKATGQDVYLYFSVEQKEEKPSVEQARQVLESIKQSNAHDSDIQELPAIGDEAFSLSAGPESTSLLIMARKGVIIMRLQIKNAPTRSALNEVTSFARRVSKQL